MLAAVYLPLALLLGMEVHLNGLDESMVGSLCCLASQYVTAETGLIARSKEELLNY
jgi:hypothetical protein